ncbi:MAG: hypothetical protein ACREPZ_10325 [Rhodanobacteraceae bacterium]
MTDSNLNIFNSLPSDGEVIARARAVFKSACEGTDSYHALRLGLARRKTLNAGAGQHLAGFWAALAGTAIACCALAVGLVWMHPARQMGPAASVASSSAPIAAEPADSEEAGVPEIGSSQMEMVQDLDFYRWVATQPAAASPPSRGSR